MHNIIAQTMFQNPVCYIPLIIGTVITIIVALVAALRNKYTHD